MQKIFFLTIEYVDQLLSSSLYAYNYATGIALVYLFIYLVKQSTISKFDKFGQIIRWRKISGLCICACVYVYR